MSEKNLVAKNMNLLKLQRYQEANHDAYTRIGMPTWESVKLKGTLYDFDTPIDEFLSVYASQYDVVELYETFQEIPSERRLTLLRHEVEEVNQNFRFLPFIPRRISHEFPWGENHYDMKEFLGSISQLGIHLGPCILRLPETFSPGQWKSLEKFFKTWPSDKRLALLFTHVEWFKKIEALKAVHNMIQGTPVSILLEDRIELPLDSVKLLAGDHLIVRFFGRPELLQDEDRLAMWVYRLGEYKGYGIKDSYFILYEQEERCLNLLRKMANSMGGNVRVPESFDQNSKQMNFDFR